MRRTTLHLTLIALLLIAMAASTTATPPPRILIDGVELALSSDQQPQIQAGRTLVPMRAIFEALGAAVRWEGNTQTVTGQRGERTVVLRIGAPVAVLDGRESTLDQPPVIIDGRTYVPLRFVSEALGGAVAWDDATRTIRISSPPVAFGPPVAPRPAPEPTPAPEATPTPTPAADDLPIAAPAPAATALRGAPLPVRSHESKTFGVGTLKITVQQEPTFTWPLETPKIRMVATNTGQVPVRIPFQARVKETNQEASGYPQPPILYLGPGESQTITTILDAEAGRVNTLPPDTISQRTVVWSFAGQGTLETQLSIRRLDLVPQPGRPGPVFAAGMTVAGRVVDEEGEPLANVQVEARAGSTGLPTGTGWRGDFRLTLPSSFNWVITAARPGYRTAYVFLDEARDYSDLTIVLHPQAGTGFTYQPTAVLEHGNVGFWQGTLTPDESLLLLPQGMEIWNGAVEPYRRAAGLMLYTTGGKKLWEHAMGYEAWGADISRDGLWAVYAAKDPLKPELVLLDATNGQRVWARYLDTTRFPSGADFTGHQSNEVRFSPDAAYIGVGTGEGDFYLVRSSDGAIVWSAFLKGQVRAVVFSPDGQFVYAGAGNGTLVKMRLQDGSVVWQAPIGAWPLLEGMKLAPDGTMIGTMSKAGEATVVDTETGRVLFTFDTAGIGQWADFSGDSRVFVAASFGGTYGFVADSGERLFRLDGGKAGRFAKGQNFLIISNGNNNFVYDYWGTRISNRIPGLDPPAQPGQFAWVSADGRTVILAASSVQQPGTPVLFMARGEPSAIPAEGGMGPGAPGSPGPGRPGLGDPYRP